MKLNIEKCHFIVFGGQSDDLTIQIETIVIHESTEQKLLGIKLDKKLLSWQNMLECQQQVIY